MRYELSHTLIPQIIRCLPCRTSKVMLLEELMMEVILDEELFEAKLFYEALFQRHHLLSVLKR